MPKGDQTFLGKKNQTNKAARLQQEKESMEASVIKNVRENNIDKALRVAANFDIQWDSKLGGSSDTHGFELVCKEIIKKTTKKGKGLKADYYKLKESLLVTQPIHDENTGDPEHNLAFREMEDSFKKMKAFVKNNVKNNINGALREAVNFDIKWNNKLGGSTNTRGFELVFKELYLGELKADYDKLKDSLKTQLKHARNPGDFATKLGNKALMAASALGGALSKAIGSAAPNLPKESERTPTGSGKGSSKDLGPRL